MKTCGFCGDEAVMRIGGENVCSDCADVRLEFRGDEYDDDEIDVDIYDQD